MGNGFYDGLALKYDSVYNDRRSLNENTAVGYLLEPFRDRDTLDMGCGTALAANIGGLRRYWGLDMAPKMIARARVNMPTGVFVIGDMAERIFADEKFGGVVSVFGSFSYARDAGKVAREVWRVLAPGGRFLIMAYGPNHTRAAGYKKLVSLAGMFPPLSRIYTAAEMAAVFGPVFGRVKAYPFSIGRIPERIGGRGLILAERVVGAALESRANYIICEGVKNADTAIPVRNRRVPRIVRPDFKAIQGRA